MLSQQLLGDIEEFAAEQLIVHGEPPQKVVCALARQYPDVTGLTIVFALTTVAHHLERPPIVNSVRPLPKPIEIYRVVSLLSSDLFELNETLKIVASGADLIEHWEKNSEKLFCFFF